MSARTCFLALLAAAILRVTAFAQPSASVVVEPKILFPGGAPRALALRNNGDLLTWGGNYQYCSLGRPTASLATPDPNPVVIMHNVKEIAASGFMNLALTLDGKVYSWGAVPMGSGRYPCDGPGIVASLADKIVTHIGVSAGFHSHDDFAVVVTDTGDLYCWGSGYSCPAIQSRNPDSSFRGGDSDSPPTFTRLNLPELNGKVLDIRLGQYHTLVLTKDRKLYAFGRSRWGQLGDARFTQTGAVFGFTPEPVLTNVASFAAGVWHSVAVKGDGTVWTWGHNEWSELCDGTTTTRRVPTQLPPLPEEVVQVAALGTTTLLRTKSGALYGCGSNQTGSVGLERPKTLPHGADPTMPVQTPTRIPVPPIKSSVLVVSGNNSAFSPDGCAVYIAGEGAPGVRGVKEPSSAQFTLRAGLTLCAPSSPMPMPDVDVAALHPVAPAPSSVDCWMAKRENFPKDTRLAPLRQALLTVERIIKANENFIPQIPEGVRMGIVSDKLRLSVSAFPRQAGPYPQWTKNACDVLDGKHAATIGTVEVVFNGGLSKPASSFRELKPDHYVAGIPVYRTTTKWGNIDDVVITLDGRLPITPVTLIERLDKLTENLTNNLESVRRELTVEKRPPVLEIHRQREAELRRQLDVMRAYRASFSASELQAPLVVGDMQGPESREVDARVKALEALSAEDQAQVNLYGTQARALQRQALTRGLAPAEAARLRGEATDLLQKASALVSAQHKRVEAEVTALRSDFLLKLNKPGDVSQATQFKDDENYYDAKDPTRIRMIVVHFSAGASRETPYAKAKAWMDKVEGGFDYAALKALIR